MNYVGLPMDYRTGFIRISNEINMRAGLWNEIRKQTASS